MKKSTVKSLVLAAIVAALYTVLTMALQAFSFGAIQLRISEVLTVLPVFFPAAVPGLFVGCLLSNLMGGSGWIDVVFGSLATLIAAYGTYRLRRNIWLAMLPPVLINAVVVAAILKATGNHPFMFTMLSVGVSQAIVCYGLGVPLAWMLKKNKYLMNTFALKSTK